MNIKIHISNKIDVIITLILLIPAIALLVFSFCIAEPFKSLLINLVAAIFGSIITIWGIEFIRRKHMEIRESTAKTMVRDEIIQLKNTMVSYIAGPLGFSALKYEYNTKENIEKWGEVVIKDIVNNILKQDLLVILEQLDTNGWFYFKTNISSIRSALLEKIQLYKEVLPPEILGQLFKINKICSNIWVTFNLMPELFTEKENNWPSSGSMIESLRSARNILIKSLSRDLKYYFESINVLIKLLEEIKF